MLSTPGMIAMMERTAAVLAYESLPEGSATVGFEVCVKHVAGAAEGATLHRLGEADRRRRRTQALLRRRGQGGRADDRRRHPPAPRHPGAGPGPPGSLSGMADFPSRVRIREVGPRDGFQNEPEVIATADKVRLIEMLIASGPEADRGHLVRPPRRDPAARRRPRGARRARASRRRRLLGPDPERARARERAPRAATASTRSASSSRPRRPTTARTSTARSTSRSTGSSGSSRPPVAEGLRCEGVIATSFGCPYEGEVPPERVFGIAERLARLRLRGDRLRRHDRDGQPAAGRRVLRRGRSGAARPGAELTAHFHNTRGQGLANARRRARPGSRLVRVELRRARRLPGPGRARPATSPPRTSSRCCTRWGSRPASTSRRCSPPHERSRSARPAARRPPADRRSGRLGAGAESAVDHAAFLRGMNLGNRRITNDELRGQFEALGFRIGPRPSGPAGNVVFEAGRAVGGEADRPDRGGPRGGARLRGPDGAPDGEASSRELAAAEPFDLPPTSQPPRASSRSRCSPPGRPAKSRKAVLALATDDGPARLRRARALLAAERRHCSNRTST